MGLAAIQFSLMKEEEEDRRSQAEIKFFLRRRKQKSNECFIVRTLVCIYFRLSLRLTTDCYRV